MTEERDPCKKQKWRCPEDEPLWRMYMNSYLENERRLEKDDKYDRRRAVELARLPALETTELIQASQTCFPLNTFNIDAQIKLPDRLNNVKKIRIWRNMKSDPLHREVSLSSIPSKTERKKWPCSERNYYEEQRELERLARRENKCLLPCQDDSENELDLLENFADNKELGHARVPVTCKSEEKYYLVDRAAGEKPGLVDGDYISLELSSDTGDKLVFSEVCLRGLKGMHLVELSRERENSWKFCFYQGIVALLAKTQLRYKHATSVNVDFIYDHAWMLFIHMGSMNVKKNLQLDDIVVYNYKYSISLELLDELSELPKISDIDWSNYLEENFNKIHERKRPELMKKRETIGWEKISLDDELDVHPETKIIEYLLENIPDNIKNYLIKTSRFSIACWKDGNFWYIYNPYRCDKFGFWNDSGYACIMKFCSKKSLIRHLMIILLRANAYNPASPLKIFYKDTPSNSTYFFGIKIFKIIYHCVKIHDLRVLQRPPVKPRVQKVTTNDEEIPISLASNVEKLDWLLEYKIIWKKNSSEKKINGSNKAKWHDYTVEEEGKIFSLWGEIHATETTFDVKNRGNQIYACCIICAGMTKIISPEYWSTKTLNTIVMCGDRYYTLSRQQNENSHNNGKKMKDFLLKFFKIGNILFNIDIIDPISGKLYTDKSLFKLLDDCLKKYGFIILTCENYCLGVFKSCGAYYMFDAKSIGPPLFDYGHGLAYLIRTTNFIKLLHVVILTIGSNERSEFNIFPIDILKTVDVTVFNSSNEKSWLV